MKESFDSFRNMATPDQDKESNTSEKESFADEALDLAAQQCQRPKMMANARSKFT